MKPRHAATLALVGWYLLVPPVTDNEEKGVRAGIHNPISQWHVSASYDTAKECERSRAQHFNIGQEQHRAGHRAVASALMATSCIATDDPRLAK
jgi:hypothetical protein